MAPQPLDPEDLMRSRRLVTAGLTAFVAFVPALALAQLHSGVNRSYMDAATQPCVDF